MRANWFRSVPLLALVFATTLVGCELPTSPMDVAESPAFSARQAELHRVRGEIPAQAATTTRIIGAEGGTIEHSGHRLSVPAGAVSEPTRFSMRALGEGFIEVELKATSLQGKPESNDVGSRGFARPLTLELSYRSAREASDPAGLVVVWVRDDGILQAVPGTVDAQTRTVRGALDHFSRYAIASN